jgi:hypothetical protein
MLANLLHDRMIIAVDLDRARSCAICERVMRLALRLKDTQAPNIEAFYRYGRVGIDLPHRFITTTGICDNA